MLFGLLGLTAAMLSGLSLSGSNHLTINEIGFSVYLEAEQRIGDFGTQTLVFAATPESYADSLAICFSSVEMDLRLSFVHAENLGAIAWQSTAIALFKTDIMLRKLSLNLVFDAATELEFLSGTKAVLGNDPSANLSITPYSNKVCAYRLAEDKFWLIASNYAGCQGVEALSVNRISLYDNELHYLRQYSSSTNQHYYPRDCRPFSSGQSISYSWLWFETEPLILDIKRWPGDKKAALAISNDPDGESPDRIKAVFWGSSDVNSPIYGNQGFASHGIPVTNGIFGADQSSLGQLLPQLLEAGSSIAYHTYENLEDAPGTNASSLLNNLLPYRVRLWTDHSVPNNPECLSFNGLTPGSANFIGDVIQQSEICYAWAGDQAATNPFNAFDDPWRLPHRLFELNSVTKPLWFFGRTRALTWEYLNSNIAIDMKHIMTSENLDKLLQDEGLHVTYTNFFQSNSWERNAFYIDASNGGFQIRPEVEDMIMMLAWYRDHRKLWLATAEDIFDRLLALEQVYVETVNPNIATDCTRITLSNRSENDLIDLSLRHGDNLLIMPFLTAGGNTEIMVNPGSMQLPQPTTYEYLLRYQYPRLYLSKKDGAVLNLQKLNIYNLKGQKVRGYDSAYPAEVIDLSFDGFASGIYIAEIKEKNLQQKLQRFVVLK